jgi:RNA polymerase sigma-70 factor (ECF subfamily)
MMSALELAFRAASGRIIAVLAARYRDLDLAEEAFAEACARAIPAWRGEVPAKPDAWLFRVSERTAVDILRKRAVRERMATREVLPEPAIEVEMLDDEQLIPDERLRLIFVCCHPAVAPESRAALTLRVVCGLTTAEIGRAFLVGEATLAQRLVRAKRKIADAGVPFEIPGPQLWIERLDAVLSTLEVAYSKAHEDAAGTSAYAGYAAEMLDLTRVLSDLLPEEPDVLALAALVRFAEARRGARTDEQGCMVPLSMQDPTLWNRALIAEGDAYLMRGFALRPSSMRLLQAGIHAAWCTRRSLAEPPPWPRVLALYDALIEIADDPIARLNRIVALAEVRGVDAALAELDRLQTDALETFLPYHAVRADLLRRAGECEDAAREYDAALALDPGEAEARWLITQRDSRMLFVPLCDRIVTSH